MNKIPEETIDEIKKNYPQGINSIGKIYNTCCEWCDNTTKVAHIKLNRCSRTDISYSVTWFSDPKFRLQSEWWVCGQCE